MNVIVFLKGVINICVWKPSSHPPFAELERRLTHRPELNELVTKHIIQQGMCICDVHEYNAVRYRNELWDKYWNS